MTSYTAFNFSFNIVDESDVGRAIQMLETIRSGMSGNPGTTASVNKQAPNSNKAPSESTPVPTGAFGSPETDPTIGVELDANGTPWLESVHAGTKSKNADGTWRAKRGVSKEDIESAETEARWKLAGTPTPAEQPPVEETEAAPAPVDYETVMEKFMHMSANGTITNDQMIAFYQELDISADSLSTDETARAKLFDRMVRHEQEQTETNSNVLPGLPGMSA